MSPIQTRIEAENWLEKRLRLEGPGLWKERERKELADQVAQDYRPGGARWHVKQWMQRPEGIPVYVVTRGDLVGIHTIDDRDKADAIMRTLNALDAEVRPPGAEA